MLHNIKYIEVKINFETVLYVFHIVYKIIDLDETKIHRFVYKKQFPMSIKS